MAKQGFRQWRCTNRPTDRTSRRHDKHLRDEIFPISLSFTKAEADKLRRRVELFRQETLTRNGLTTTLVTTFGLDRNANSDYIDTIVSIDQLFE